MRGGEAPSVVKREDQIIETHKDLWSCLIVIIGGVLVKVVRTVTLKEPSGHQKSIWYFFH